MQPSWQCVSLQAVDLVDRCGGLFPSTLYGGASIDFFFKRGYFRVKCFGGFMRTEFLKIVQLDFQ